MPTTKPSIQAEEAHSIHLYIHIYNVFLLYSQPPSTLFRSSPLAYLPNLVSFLFKTHPDQICAAQIILVCGLLLKYGCLIGSYLLRRLTPPLPTAESCQEVHL